MANLYYTNASGDYTWENLANWNTAADGSGSNPTEIPWTETDGSTSASNLIDASGGAGVTISQNTFTTIDPNGVVSGTCDISSITANGQAMINGGAFTGANFQLLDGIIHGGTFTGDYFTNNYGGILGGTFTGNYVSNVSMGSIQDALFAGNNFLNGGDGTSCVCTNITFTGNGFTNAQGAQVINCDFSGGTGFSDWSVQGCYFGSNGTFIQNGQNFTFNDEFAAIVYPASGSGGGNSLIARLLNLPPFINI
jgi:hypothetical protein